MSQRPDDFEDVLRRALHAAADPAEPSDDGLEQIHARLRTPYPLLVAWLMAAWSGMSRRALGGLDAVWSWLHTVPGPGNDRSPAQPGTPGQRRLARVRLAAALAMAALVVAIGAFAGAPVLRQQVASLTGALVSSLDGSGPGGTGGSGVNGQGNPLPPSGGAPVGGTTPSTPDNQQPGPANSSAQTPALATPPASQSPALSTSPAPSTCPTPTPSTSPTPTPSSSPTPSTSPTHSTSPTPTPSSSLSASTSPTASTSSAACPSPGTTSSLAGPIPAASPSPDTSSSPDTSFSAASSSPDTLEP